MSNGNSFKECFDEPRHSFRKDGDDNPDPFLARSLQFLHRLLAERTLQYANLNANGTTMSQLEVEDVQKQDNASEKQLYFQQIDQIEEYKRQLRSMEDFLSSIQLDPEKPLRNTTDSDTIISNETNDERWSGDPRNLQFTKMNGDSYDSMSQNPSLCASTHSYSNCNELATHISERTKIDVSGFGGPAMASLTVQRSAPDTASDLTGRSEAHSVFSTSSSLKNNSIQRSSSYADVVRNAVAGLARNCRKKHKSGRKKHVASNWLPEAEIMKSPNEERNRKRNQIEVESEISSKSHIPKEIPLRVQFAMETDSSPRKTVTLRVKVPNTVFNLLNSKISDQDTEVSSIDHSSETRTEPGKKKKRITSVFRNLLKGRRTPSSTTVYSTKQTLQSHVTLVLERTSDDAEDQANNTIDNTSIYNTTLPKSASCDSFDREKKCAEFPCNANNESTIKPRNTECTSVKCMFIPPTKNVNGYERISLNISPRVISYETKPWNEKAAATTWRKLADDEALQTEMPSNKTEDVNSLTNYCDEKIIPLRCAEGSPHLGKKRREISQRDVETFLKLAAEMRKTQVYRDADDKHVEMPVEIKTMETPLHLRRTENISEDFLDYRVFHPIMKSSLNAMPNGIETQQFLEMLVGTLPEGDYVPQNKYTESQELLSSLYSIENEPAQDNFQHSRNIDESALEVLLRHIATDTSTTSYSKPYAAEKDTTAQNAPKRQLSKVSVCYSSESLSGSDHENPEVGRMEISTVSQCEYKVHNHVLSNKSRKPGNGQYFHNYESAERNDTTCCYGDDNFVFHDESENRYADMKMQSSTSSLEVNKQENSNLTSSPSSIKPESKLISCSRTEVIIEEQNCGTIEAEVNAQVVMDGERPSLSIRETERTLFCHPVLSRQICRDRKELADAMIRWWGPQINYSTTPSSQTHLSAYSVCINNLM